MDPDHGDNSSARSATQGGISPAPAEESIELLTLAARMMVEFNIRSAILLARLDRLAKHLGIDAKTSTTYRRVSICLADGRNIQAQVREYRLNVAVSSEVLQLINLVCSDGISPARAIEQMRLIEAAPPCQGRWLLAVMFGLAASALACILKADAGTIAISGLSSALGLLLRRELGRRHYPIFVLPFAAAALGGLIGGLADRWSLTQTTGLCLLVPALMLVPGPHLINGLFDIFENQLETGVYRLVLAVIILLAAASGTLVGGWAVIHLNALTDATSDSVRLTLWLDMILAGVAASGFAAFYNSPWRVLWISVVCGVVGHAIRFLCLGYGVGLPISTLLGCTAIGLLASFAATYHHLPFSSIAFAGAVPMMPGSLMYRSISGAFRLVAAGDKADPTLATAAAVHLLQAMSVVGAMAIGLLLGSSIVTLVNAAVRQSKRALQQKN